MKVYLKRGMPNYKEKRLIEAIQKVVAEKIEKDSTFVSTFQPAKDFDELKKLHGELCIENADFEEIESENDNDIPEETDTEKQHRSFRSGINETVEQQIIDPFNDAEPIVRDYVTENGFKDNDNQNVEQKTRFDEPTNYKESFEMPSDEDEKSDNTSNKKTEKQAKKPTSAPINPQFQDMDNGKKKRSTKKMAKLIVDAVCILAEKGCIYWTTKDITPDKIAKYELEDTIDMQIILALDENQETTVKNWFAQKVSDANTLFKVSKEDKDDLTDSLFEVMIEKGIAPTPMQELIINAVKTFVIDMGLKAIQLSAEIKNVIEQLKVMKKQDANTEDIDYGDANINDDIADENPATPNESVVPVIENSLTIS